MQQDIAKKAAGVKAATLIQSGMTVGLGTGSTVKYFLEALAKRIKEENLSIKCAATSKETEKLAHQLHIPLSPIESIDQFDVDVDGADQIDDDSNMIKGGGGALLREKIIAHASKEMIVLIDKTKRVNKLGGIPLPIEIIPFGSNLTIKCIKKLNLSGHLRKKKDGSLFITDNGNLIFDADIPKLDVKELNINLLEIPGVVETGFFIDYAVRLIMGHEDGSTSVS